MQTQPRFHVILFLGMLLLFAPTWLWLGEAWLSNPYYSHGPIVVIVALYFAWVQAKTLGDLARTSNPLGWGVLIVALAFHLWATFWRAYYLSALMIPLALLGLLLILFGRQTARRFAFPLAFLVLMVPLPIAERIGPLLEQWTTTSAVALTQLVGIAAHNVGAQVFLPNTTFMVGIPCGGLRSAIAIITLTTLLAYILQGPLWARLALFLAALPIAFAANTLRITLLFAVAVTWGPDAALNYFHDWSSPVLFTTALALILLLAKLLRMAQIRWEIVFPQ